MIEIANVLNLPMSMAQGFFVNVELAVIIWLLVVIVLRGRSK